VDESNQHAPVGDEVVKVVVKIVVRRERRGSCRAVAAGV
jgi:hypothetical protein